MICNHIETVFPISSINNFAQISFQQKNLCTNESLYAKIFINEDGKIVAKFEDKLSFYVRRLSPNYTNLFVIGNFNGIYQIVLVRDDLTYKILREYEDIEFGIEDGCFAVKNNGLWGFINEEANEIIEPQYDDYCSFSHGLAAVCKNGKWGFINKQNEVVIPFEYEIPKYSCFNEYHAPVGLNGKFGFIDQCNRVVISFKYENALIRSVYGELFPVKQNSKWRFINSIEEIVIQLEFDNVECNSDGYSVYHVMQKVENKKLYGLIDTRTNKLLVPCRYLSLCPNPNSIQAQKQNNKYVLLNWNGEEISEEYDFIEEYSNEGLYIARNDAKEGYITENGNVEIPFIYQKCEDFYGGFAVVKNKGCWQVIDRKNSVILRGKQHDEIYNTGVGIYILENSEELSFWGNLTSSLIENISAENLKPEAYKFIKNIDARSEFWQKIGTDKMLQYGKVVDTYENYPHNEMWAKSEFKIIDMHKIVPAKSLTLWFRDLSSDYTYAPFLYMKNQTTGVYHLEGLHPGCKTLYDALKMRYNGLNINNYEIKGIK